MNQRISISGTTQQIFNDIDKKFGLKPFALSKISLALSLRNIRQDVEYDSDTKGMDLQISTITSGKDAIYKSLILIAENVHIPSSELHLYFKKHIDRGAELLRREFQQRKHFKDFVIHLSNTEGGIQ